MTMITNIPDSSATVPIARTEREAARKMLLSFSDRQLRDIGLCRSQIEHALDSQHQPD